MTGYYCYYSNYSYLAYLLTILIEKTICLTIIISYSIIYLLTIVICQLLTIQPLNNYILKLSNITII